MKKREPVSHIMTKNVHSVLETADLRTVAGIFKSENIHHLPIMRGHEIVGIISSSDINRLSINTLYDNQDGGLDAILDSLTLGHLMTQNPVVVETTDSILEIAEVFANANFHALPVVEGQELKGIVTTKDIIKYFLDQA
ncbi:MAG: CBS domain-containing protein [Bacteroidetes bacterium]|nr:CBS domain-containing protein [Bacteroidota bacterium]